MTEHPVTQVSAVKIFQAFGKDGIDMLDGKVNDFLENEDIEVISITPQMCSVGHGRDEIYQMMTITVWYRWY